MLKRTIITLSFILLLAALGLSSISAQEPTPATPTPPPAATADATAAQAGMAAPSADFSTNNAPGNALVQYGFITRNGIPWPMRPACFRLPPVGWVTLFTGPNYTGVCRSYPMWAIQYLPSVGFWDDAIVSIRMGAGTFAVLCDGWNWTGRCLLNTINVPDLGVYGMSYNISSMTIQSRLALPTAGWVTMFDQPGFGGNWIRVSVGSINRLFLFQRWQDRISSVLSGSWTAVELHENESLNRCCPGRSEYIGLDVNLDNNWIGTNTTSSLTVFQFIVDMGGDARPQPGNDAPLPTPAQYDFNRPFILTQ
jgi:hypothetical protein